MYVLGTAGHVDHGKSALVQALTGMDPDRLREEKERGLTIDLGFAWLSLPSGRDLSIVDVPGHERFIKNMLAGAGGVDIALLVVAADEGPMPQTREHLAILDLLDIPAGLAVITKCDLVDDDYLDLVETELSETLAGSCLAGAPIVRASAQDGRGISEILGALDALLDTTPRKRNLGRPRLPIDRAFSIQGFGAVVTGTLVDGALEVGQEVELQPGGQRARIRGLQRHKAKVERLEPGTRAAVNLSGLRVEDLERGMVLALPGSLGEVRVLDMALKATELLSHPVAHAAGVTFLSATTEAQGQLRLLDRDELFPGEEAWAQVKLDEPVAVAVGDRCVLRTTNDTIGGGPIVALNPPRHRRKHAATLDALRRKAKGGVAERVLDELLAGPSEMELLGKKLIVEQVVLQGAVNELTSAGLVQERAGRLLAAGWLENVRGRVLAVTRAYLAANSLSRAAPREHVRSASGLDATTFDLVVADAVEAGRIEERGAKLAPPGYAVVLSAEQQEEVDRFLESIAAGGYSPPTDDLPDAALLAYLVDEGKVAATRGGVVFDADIYREMLEQVRTFIDTNGSITLAQARDIFGTSRKYAQAFLEHLDERRVTRRVGDERILRG